MMKTLASFAVSSLFVSLVGCGDDLTALTEQQLAFPASCLEAGGGDAPATGLQTLHVGNDEQKPWQAMCHVGQEFLPTSASMGSITPASGDQIYTEYSYLRIDPRTLTIDLTDTTFASTNGGPLELGGARVVAAPAGVAFSADANATAFGQLDITSSNFRVKTAFELVGPGVANSNVSVHRDDRWIESYVSDCASGPAGMPAMPTGLGAKLTVELVWAGPEAP